MNEVSVIITVYNGKTYLAKAIESVISQTVKAQEIIVVDDGSTDGSGDIVKNFPMVNYIIQKNMGVAAARNSGITEARNEFIAFLDHDDFFPNNKIELSLAHFKQNPELDVVRGLYECYFDTPEMEQKYSNLINLTKNNHGVLMGTALFRRSIFDKIGLFDITLAAADDVDLWIRLNAQANVKNINEICLYYRQHMNNTMKTVDYAKRNAMSLIKIVNRKIQNERGIK